MAFHPIKNLDKTVEDYLLNGYIVKADCGATNYIHIIPREKKNEWEVKGQQMSQHRKSEIEGAITMDKPNLSNIFDNLEKNGYTILSEDVFSGCCQYHTRIYYLAGEES